jgi:bla regulator protein blaR1
MALSATLLLALAISSGLLAYRKRGWPTRRLFGIEVHVASEAGPAVIGLLRPRIVLPQWLMQAPTQQQALVMAHEASHLTARDPQLLGLALLVLVAMPWNLPLWWQLRRLRHAIEVDCDARVLAAGHDPQQYCAALIDVGARHSGLAGGAVAMAQSRSFLEQRLRILVRAPGRWRKPAGAALAAMALCTVAVAAQLAQPEAAQRSAVQLAPALLAEYAGTYQTDEFQAMVIGVDGGRLMSQVTGRPRIEQFASSRDHFFQPRARTALRFNRDAAGKVVSLTVTLLGVDIEAPRVEGVALAGRIAAHVGRDGPMPGGEAALRRGADSITTGKIFPEDLTPHFFKLSEKLMPLALADMRRKPVGKMQSLSWLGVNRDTGEDIYRVEYEKRALDWYLMVHSDGKIANARALPVPQ